MAENYKIISSTAVSLLLHDEVAWDTYMNGFFQIWHDKELDLYALSNNYMNPCFYGRSLTIEQLTNILKSFNPFLKISKFENSIYVGVVEFVLDSMFDLASKDSSYCILLDLVHYYKSTIATEGKLSADEFINLVELCARKHKGKEGV